MTIIICDSDIEYTKGDTFVLNVTTPNGFDTGTQLDLIISDNENNTPIINNTYSLNSDNEFAVTLTPAETNTLSYQNYLYKLTLHTPEGEIITQKSGNFKVKWGA